MYGGNRRVEDIDAFEEERALLGKEDGEALVRRDDELVCFDLRKVRIDGEVEGDVRRDCVLTGQSGIELDGIIHHAPWIEHARRGLRRSQS